MQSPAGFASDSKRVIIYLGAPNVLPDRVDQEVGGQLRRSLEAQPAASLSHLISFPRIRASPIMPQTRPTHRRGMRCAALLTLVSVALGGAARSALADCSHRERPVLAIDLGSTPVPTLVPRSEWIAPSLPIGPTTPERPKPCSGPQCSGKSAPVSGPAPLPVPRSASADAWAWLASAQVTPTPRSAFLATEDHLVCPRLVPSSIFHPPRPTR